MSSFQKAIIIGASSGIGRALAVTLSKNNYELGLTARRTELLQSLSSELPHAAHVCPMDLKDVDGSLNALRELAQAMGKVDLIIINSGINRPNEELALAPEVETLDVNVRGFMAMACAAIELFEKQGFGHLVAISSIAGLRGSPRSPAYSASKAYVSNYMEGLRFKLSGTAIATTDIRPGFVDTAMIADRESAFLVASCEKAAEQIYTAIRKKKKIAYVTRCWGFVAMIYQFLPAGLFAMLYNKYKR